MSSKTDKKEKRSHIEPVSVMEEDITTDAPRNPKNNRNTKKQLDVHKFDKLGEMDQFIEMD